MERWRNRQTQTKLFLNKRERGKKKKKGLSQSRLENERTEKHFPFFKMLHTTDMNKLRCNVLTGKSCLGRRGWGWVTISTTNAAAIGPKLPTHRRLNPTSQHLLTYLLMPQRPLLPIKRPSHSQS